MENYIRLAWELACMLRTYRKCDPTVGFSKCEFNNKLLVGVTFFRVTISYYQNYIVLVLFKTKHKKTLVISFSFNRPLSAQVLSLFLSQILIFQPLQIFFLDFRGILVIFRFQGYFGHFLGFRGILVNFLGFGGILVIS